MGMTLAIPQHSKKSPDGLLKSLLVGTSGMLPKRFFARNSHMILVPTMGLCRASMFVPLNEQDMDVKGNESKLLQKNVSLPITIPLMVPLWWKLPLCALCATITLRYCHNPRI